MTYTQCVEVHTQTEHLISDYNIDVLLLSALRSLVEALLCCWSLRILISTTHKQWEVVLRIVTPFYCRQQRDSSRYRATTILRRDRDIVKIEYVLSSSEGLLRNSSSSNIMNTSSLIHWPNVCLLAFYLHVHNVQVFVMMTWYTLYDTQL